MAVAIFTSIKIVDGQVQLPSWHLHRIKHALTINNSNMKFNSLSELIAKVPLPQEGVHKLKVIVHGKGMIEYVIEPYMLKQIDKVRFVQANNIEYENKFLNRNAINVIKQNHAPQENEDVVILKHSEITDSSYSNICFWDGKQWVTPKSYLLNGIKRQYLLATNQIAEKEISLLDIANYSKLCFINAMLELGEVEIAQENFYIS
jgi:4-amino-4-deoxychorismate lyase